MVTAAVLAADRPGRQRDAGLFESVNRFAQHTTWLHGVVKLYATLGVGLFALLLLAGWWTARSRSSEKVAAAVWSGAAGLLAVALNQPLVSHFNQARPYTSLPGILVLADRSSDPSFPSDHATLVGAVAAGLWFADRRVGAAATVAALGMGFSRVYTASHYPHDIAAGLILGVAVAVPGWFALRRPLTSLVDRLKDTPIRPLVTDEARP